MTSITEDFPVGTVTARPVKLLQLIFIGWIAESLYRIIERLCRLLKVLTVAEDEQ